MGGIVCVESTTRPLLLYQQRLSFSFFSPLTQQDTRLVYGRHFAIGHLGLGIARSPSAFGDGECREESEGTKAGRERKRGQERETSRTRADGKSLASDTPVLICRLFSSSMNLSLRSVPPSFNPSPRLSQEHTVSDFDPSSFFYLVPLTLHALAGLWFFTR
jgi:hypothetical protein